MRDFKAIAAIILLAACVSACSSSRFTTADLSVLPRPAPVVGVDRARLPAAPSFTETGIASWYGRECQHEKTASGERYDMRKLTAAHRSLPFGTRVRVTNLKNGRSVTVVINDRGPYVGHRIIDLSAKAARVLGMRNAGTAPVRLEVYAANQPDRYAMW